MISNQLIKISKPFKWSHEYLNEILCSGKDRIVENKLIQKAFSEVDRRDFTPPDFADEAYLDQSIEIGWNEKLNKPTTIALMLQLLDVKKGGRYLDIGTGTGYVAAILSTAVGKRGQIISIERKQFLLEIARINISKYPFIKNLILQLGDGYNGYKDLAPYDGIHVSASYDKLPELLKGQLKIGGKLIAPLNTNELILIKRQSVTSFKETLHKTYFFDKIETGIE